MKKSLIICLICTIFLSPIIYKILDYYIFAIEINVPIIGYINTGITKYQLKQFEIAENGYKNKIKEIDNLYRSNKITAKDRYDRITTINITRLSDPRITALTGGPAKSFLKFLLDKI